MTQAQKDAKAAPISIQTVHYVAETLANVFLVHIIPLGRDITRTDMGHAESVPTGTANATNVHQRAARNADPITGSGQIDAQRLCGERIIEI